MFRVHCEARKAARRSEAGDGRSERIVRVNECTEVNRALSERLKALKTPAERAAFQRDFAVGSWFTSHPNCDPAVSAIRERMDFSGLQAAAVLKK